MLIRTGGLVVKVGKLYGGLVVVVYVGRCVNVVDGGTIFLVVVSGENVATLPA